MHWTLGRQLKPEDDWGSAIFLAPLLIVIMAYLTGFFVDLGDAMTKADGFDQSLSLAAAAGSTQVSATEFYRHGLMVLNPSTAQNAAITQIETTLPQGTTLIGSPSVVVSQGAICIRASERIKLPFSLVPGISPYISYSSSSSAFARGSATKMAPTC